MALATVEHHSYGPTANDALRGQRTVTRAGEGEVREEHQALRGQTRLPPKMRPALLVEVQPQGRVGRHFAEHLAELAPLVQILDAPVPQVVDNVMDAFKFLDQPMTEQVIEVPRISCPPCPSRSQVPVALTAEQLVEVPTVVLFLAPAADCRADHCYCGSSSWRRCSWRSSRLSPGTGFNSGLWSRLRRQSSSSRSWRRCSWRSSRPLPGTGLNSGLWSRFRLFSISSRSWRRCSWRSSRPLPGTGLNSGLWSRFRRFSSFSRSWRRCSWRFPRHLPGQGSTAFCEAEDVDISVPHGRGKLGDGVFSSSSAGAAEEGPAVRGSGMGKAGSTGYDAPRGSSSRGKAGSTSDDALRVLAARGNSVFFEFCEFFIHFGGKWVSQGHGFAKLVQHSSGAQYFEFWQNEQVWYDDVIHRVGSDVLVLKPSRSGRAWSWMDPDFVGGPSEYRHAVRFPSPELARRFHAVWMGSGVRGLDSCTGMARLVLLVILHLALFLLYVASFLEMTSGMAFGRISHVARLHGCLRILRNAWFDTGYMPFGTLQCACPQLQLRSPS